MDIKDLEPPHRYVPRAFQQDDPNAPEGSWGVFDRKLDRYVHPIDMPKIDQDERMVS